LLKGNWWLGWRPFKGDFPKASQLRLLLKKRGFFFLALPSNYSSLFKRGVEIFFPMYAIKRPLGHLDFN